MGKRALANVSRAELVSVAKQVKAYNRESLGTSPSKATKKELRNGIAKKIVLGGSIAGAILLAAGGGALVYRRKRSKAAESGRVFPQFYQSSSVRRKAAAEQKKPAAAAAAAAAQIPPPVAAAVTPTGKDTKKVQSEIERDRDKIRKFCADESNGTSEMTVKEKRMFIMQMFEKYTLVWKGKAVQKNPTAIYQLIADITQNGISCSELEIAIARQKNLMMTAALRRALGVAIKD